MNVYKNDLDAVKFRFFMFRIENGVVSIIVYTMIIYLSTVRCVVYIIFLWNKDLLLLSSLLLI